MLFFRSNKSITKKSPKPVSVQRNKNDRLDRKLKLNKYHLSFSQEAIASLSTETGLHQILPRLVLFISEGVKINLMQSNLAILIYLMRMTSALLENKSLYCEKYVRKHFRIEFSSSTNFFVFSCINCFRRSCRVFSRNNFALDRTSIIIGHYVIMLLHVVLKWSSTNDDKFNSNDSMFLIGCSQRISTVCAIELFGYFVGRSTAIVCHLSRITVPWLAFAKWVKK